MTGEELITDADETADVVEQEVSAHQEVVLQPVEPPVVAPPEPVHLGHPASHKSSLPLNCDLEAACKHARSLNRSVSIIVQNPSDVKEVERLMDGHKRKLLVRVSPRQTQKVLVRTL